MNNNTVWVLGSSNIDLTHNVKKLPQKGETIFSDNCLIGTGGKGANQAVAAAHFGSNVSFVGAVGDDANGQVLLNTLKSYGINTQYVHVVQNMESGNALILVDENGSNIISVFPGANNYIPLSILDEISFKRRDILIAQLEVNMEVIDKSFELAKQHHVITVLNPSPYKNLSENLLRNIDIIIVNEIEGRLLSNINVDNEISAKMCAQEIKKMGVNNVIVTLGKLGVVLATNCNTIYFPGHNVNVVDTQGAGDAFLGTTVSQIYKNKSIEEAVSLANYIASITVTREGSTQVCLPDLEKINMNYESKHYFL